MNERELRLRLRVLQAALLAIAVVFVGRLAYLQLLRGDVYRLRAEAQALKRIVVHPVRGNIYDRFGVPLVESTPAFTISVVPAEFPLERTPLLAMLLELPEPWLRKQLQEARRAAPFVPLRLVRDAEFRFIAAVEEHWTELPGVQVEIEPKRHYLTQLRLAHVLGYVREVSPQHLEQLGDRYRPGDPIGHSGVEASFEPFLRGEKGYRFVAVDALGQPVARFNEGRSDIPPQAGFDLYLGIDAHLQQTAEQLLEGKRGAIVVLDPQTGEVLAMVSKPDFVPDSLSGRKALQYFPQLLSDPERPLLNRAIQALYAPGSTWKMLVALAALQEGLISPQTQLLCAGGFTYGGRLFRCHHAHGSVNLRRAIQVSCNTFFYQLGLRVGLDRMHQYGQLFGFGRPTGIDLPGEYGGILPSRSFYDQRYGKGRWNEGGRAVNLGIGQGELSVTPLQMAVYAAALGTGVIRQPHVVRAIYNKRTQQLQPQAYAEYPVPIRAEVLELIRDAMYDVVNTPGGTALSAQLPGIAVCGKTGTAQNPHGQDHAWFIGFAPRENPRIAFCVLVENAGFGGAVAAPIARELLRSFFFRASPEQVQLPPPQRSGNL